ncbi:C-5 cytosine-specific DNA methylase [Entophlyctis luteolus]|nr:C-5 cytosine-specific DNA methylase [Entophlyctis luteolus]
MSLNRKRLRPGTSSVTALEFFSGIGGLHYGLESAVAPAECIVRQAFDINTVANAVYAHNFGICPSSRSLETIKAAEIDAYGHVDVWLLSPPCQPFTQGGNALDEKDARSKPLLHLLELLPSLKFKPSHLFLENVPNFESSKCRSLLISCLWHLGYEFREYILSPMQFGIPNDRRRYYLCATKNAGTREGQEPDLSLKLITDWSHSKSENPPAVGEYLESLTDVKPFLLPAEYITKRHNFRFDIVRPDSKRSSTITKAYGTKMIVDPNFEDSASIVDLGLRFFTPTEVARLHAFPVDNTNSHNHRLVFPSDVGVFQQYKLLGNSLNVKVIAELMRHGFFSDSHDHDEREECPKVSQRTSIRVSAVIDNIDLLSSYVSDVACGAIATFAGTTRSTFKVSNEIKEVVQLEYEAYEPMAVKQIEHAVEKARRKWPEIFHVAVHHRIGLVPVGEVSVAIAVSSPHRRDALHACEFLIDEVKSLAPIWKKEVYADGTNSWKENCNH